MDSIRRKLVDRFMASSDTNMGDVASGDSVLNSSYSESTLRQYWMPDAVSSDCYDCASTFTTFRRKHHCRICGQVNYQRITRCKFSLLYQLLTHWNQLRFFFIDIYMFVFTDFLFEMLWHLYFGEIFESIRFFTCL